MSQGFKLADATFVVAFDYLCLVFAALCGIALFREVPATFSIVGAAVIVASSFPIMRRGAAGDKG